MNSRASLYFSTRRSHLWARPRRRSFSTTTISAQCKQLSISADRLWNDIHHTSQWSSPSPGGLTRLCADDNDKKVRDWFRDQAQSIGATYKVNTIGAQFAILQGTDNSIPPIAMGSHLDSVLTGGKFDGVLGVLAGLEVLRSLKEQGITTHAPIAVVNWTNEEGSRFVPSLGASTVWAEEATVEEVHASRTLDGSPVTMGEELERIGYIGKEPSTFSEFPLSAHFELHNEQGVELENSGKSIGWTSVWQAVYGFEVHLHGQDGHAATYTMNRRQDALVGAAKVIAGIERLAHEFEGFATPTAIHSGPIGFCNIQSTTKTCYLMGNINDARLTAMRKGMEQLVKQTATEHGLTFEIHKVIDLPTGHFTPAAVDCAKRGCGDKGKEITCMSGHDSLMTVLRVPTAMIFVRSRDGISHCAKEWSDKEDCADGALALGQAVLHYDELLSSPSAAQSLIPEADASSQSSRSSYPDPESPDPESEYPADTGIVSASNDKTQAVVRHDPNVSWDTSLHPLFGDIYSLLSGNLSQDSPMPRAVSPIIIDFPPISWPGSDLQTDLVNSSTHHVLWDYFTQRALQVFLCWEPNDARLDKEYNDPYQENIPTVAVRSRPMMLASLALSAFHFAGAGGNFDNNPLVTSLMLEASKALAASRFQQQPRTCEELLATIGTASFLYLLKPTLYADMLPLSRTAAICLLSDARWKNVQMPGYQAIMQIFRWLDICAQCSLKHHVPILDEHTESHLYLRDNERANNLSSSYQQWFVHPLYAFAEALISPLKLVAWLIRVKQQGYIKPSPTYLIPTTGEGPKADSSSSAPFTLSRDRFDELVQEAEKMIRCSCSSVSFDDSQSHIPYNSSSNAPDLRTDLHHITAAVESALIILFYTRLQDVPWTSGLVRSHVAHIVDSLSDVEAGSRSANGIVFPLFVAGLEAVDTENRLKIVKKMDHLPGIWSHRESRFVACLRDVWKIRDSDPGAVWISWIHQVSPEFEDYIPC
ncbi:uncharacterized protein FFB14_07453 [Fusarium fujikuroi]|nr:uncharacterized protein FFB14_07453 [Fusarium fujikuroi]